MKIIWPQQEKLITLSTNPWITKLAFLSFGVFCETQHNKQGHQNSIEQEDMKVNSLTKKNI